MKTNGNKKAARIVGMMGVALLLIGIAVGGRDAVQTELIEALQAGRIDVFVFGAQSLDEVVVEIQNLDYTPLRISIMPGTVFSTGNLDYQRMGVVGQIIVTLGVGESRSIVVPVACLDMELKQPEPGMEFHGGIEFLGPESIATLVTIPDFQDATFRIQQFAVWTLIASPASRDDYAGIGLGLEIIEALVAQGLPEDIIAALYYLPEVVYSLSDDNIAALEYFFSNAGVPVQGADEFYILFSTGRPTMQELAYIGRMFDHYGIPVEGIAAIAANY